MVILATAESDTVLAGRGGLLPPPRTGLSPWERAPVYGLTAQVARAGGPAGPQVPAGRVVLVPWSHDCGGYPVRWGATAAWLPPGATDAIVGRLRPPEHWAGGVPTIDVFRPEMVRGAGILPGLVRWKATPEELFGFRATIPTRAQLRADPWGAVAAMQAWVRAHPELTRDGSVLHDASGAMRSAAHESVRAAPSPLAGTYRVEVSRTGGPVHIIYMRTQQTPASAVIYGDSAVPFLTAAAGYQLDMYIRAHESRLPPVHPDLWARIRRRITGPRDGGDGTLHIQLPEVPRTDGTWMYSGHLSLWNVAHTLFPNDRQLQRWISEWSEAHHRNMAFADPPGEAALRPAASAEWTEILQLPGGRAVTIRAVRISGEALPSPVDQSSYADLVFAPGG
ncbi:hypothetical protein [Longimicrobium sp.]|uniref:hypothetical protein n=1 Tax=Longimicrobium sp. TaxID=2029185 RepID=UPI002ED8FFF3